MYKELQMMIDNWKQKAENLHAKSEDKKSSPKYQLKYFKTAEIQLLQCIGEAELLLNSQPKEEPKPQLNKHDVSRNFHLHVTEDEAFAKSGSKKLMLHFGEISYKVLYEDDKGQWVDITNYSTW